MRSILGGIIALAILGILIWGIYNIVVAIYQKITLRYVTTRDVAIVVRKEFNNNFALQIATKTYPLGLYDEYNVYVLYKGQIFCIENQSLYESAHVGDAIYVLIRKGFNSRGELKTIYLSI